MLERSKALWTNSKAYVFFLSLSTPSLSSNKLNSYLFLNTKNTIYIGSLDSLKHSGQKMQTI